jgi:lipopolysaccharide/colanic/teichoic acid biosynthesis glycosyltransferase
VNAQLFQAPSAPPSPAREPSLKLLDASRIDTLGRVGLEQSVATSQGPLPVPRRSGTVATWTLKRTTDLFLASVTGAMLAPLMTVIAIAVRMESPGPVLFMQERVGRHGRRFAMWKFRTMVVGAEARRSALSALSRDPNWLDLEEDPRVTRLGRMLRRTSLDELPQLYNVLRGDMSLVGPRPLIPAEHARSPGWARTRDDVRPGMTGLWQVAGRTRLTFDEMLELDCQYVATWSPRRDVAILLRTVPAVLSGDGAN